MPDLSNQSRILEALVESLDIPDSLFEKAKERYEAVGNWLGRKESCLVAYSPRVYPQGSFRLGTVIKPVSDKDEYDIDLVCELALPKTSLSQKQLKDAFGVEIKAYVKKYSMDYPAEEGKRCWTIQYADGAQFHMDVLPSVPDGEGFRLFLASRSLKSLWFELAIAITDRTWPTFHVISPDWPCSNPNGFAQWFRSRMEAQFQRKIASMAEAARIPPAKVPEYKVKTTLQRVVQLLKRHRDIMFNLQPTGKPYAPISMIITTLAAHAYNGEDDILAAFVGIVSRMGRFIETVNGKPTILNPVNPAENFADRWEPAHLQWFQHWLNTVAAHINQIDRHPQGQPLIEALEGSFGPGLTKRAISSVASQLMQYRTVPQSPPHVQIQNPVQPWRR